MPRIWRPLSVSIRYINGTYSFNILIKIEFTITIISRNTAYAHAASCNHTRARTPTQHHTPTHTIMAAQVQEKISHDKFLDVIGPMVINWPVQYGQSEKLLETIAAIVGGNNSTSEGIHKTLKIYKVKYEALQKRSRKLKNPTCQSSRYGPSLANIRSVFVWRCSRSCIYGSHLKNKSIAVPCFFKF